MNPLRDYVLVTVSIVALALACFGGGWWMGRADSALDHQDARIAALEQRAVLAQAAAVDTAGAPATPRARATAPAQAAEPAFLELDVEGAPARGPSDAPVTLVAFLDFECPYCAKVAPTLDQLSAEQGDRLRVVFKHFPLPNHAHAMDAARAAEAAAAQGEFWGMHDRIFASPHALDAASLRGHAEALELDLAAYDAAIAAPEIEARIRADVAEAQRAGIRGTPTFVVNGSVFSGALPYEAMKAHVAKALVEARAPTAARANAAGTGR